MSVEETLQQRGSVYGEFSVQVSTVAGIVANMYNAYQAKHNIVPDYTLVIEWNYLAIKMARIAVSPDHTDNYHDLAGYAMLMEKERLPKRPPNLAERGA
jgi:hypothetical protein